jgi:hypothetical protein
MTLQLSHIFFTDALTFIIELSPGDVVVPRENRCAHETDILASER